MPSPVARTRRSPSRLTSHPPAGPNTRRMKAKADTTAPAAVWPTPNRRAKVGMTGATMPYPTATETATAARAQTSRGRRGLGDCMIVHAGTPARVASDRRLG